MSHCNTKKHFQDPWLHLDLTCHVSRVIASLCPHCVTSQVCGAGNLLLRSRDLSLANNRPVFRSRDQCWSRMLSSLHHTPHCTCSLGQVSKGKRERIDEFTSQRRILSNLIVYCLTFMSNLYKVYLQTMVSIEVVLTKLMRG